MCGVLEQVVDVRELHAAARVHHPNTMSETGDDAEVVGDEDDRAAGQLLDLLDDLEDLRLDRDIERSRGLVRDEHFGVVADRHRDHRPLPHAAGELVRVLTRSCLRLGDAHQVEHLDRPLRGRVAVEVLVRLHGLGDLVADAQHRVQRRQGILEDHRDLRPAVLAGLARLEPDELGAAKPC